MLLVIATSTMLAGCTSTEPARTSIYRETFDIGARGWTRYITHQDSATLPPDAFGCWVSWARKLACSSPWKSLAGGMVESRSPWWVDPNHAPPGGAGILQLIGFVYISGAYGSPVNDTLDLTNATLSIRLRLDDLDLKGSHIYFWFQTRDTATNRYANFALTAHPIDAAVTEGVWSDWTVQLTPDPASWTCLGSATSRKDFYGCMPVDRALHEFTVDFGFIVFPIVPPSQFPADPNSVATGVVALDRIDITR